MEQAGAEFTDQFARLDIPVLDHTLQISGNQTITVRVKCNVINVAVMTDHFLMKLFRRVRVPDSDGAVVFNAGHNLSVRTDGDFTD